MSEPRISAQKAGVPLAILVTLLIAVVGLFRGGLVTEVDYRLYRVLRVSPVVGRDMSHRQVTVDLGGGWERTVRTADYLITASPGEPVCVEHRRYLLGRLETYSLALRGYCNRPLGDIPDSRSLVERPGSS